MLTKKTLAGETLHVYDDSKVLCNFTCVDDIISGGGAVSFHRPEVTMVGYHVRFTIFKTAGAKSP